MHGSGGLSEGGESGFFAKMRSRGQGRHASRKVCMLCKNTRVCAVEVAQKYIEALRWPKEIGGVER